MNFRLNIFCHTHPWSSCRGCLKHETLRKQSTKQNYYVTSLQLISEIPEKKEPTMSAVVKGYPRVLEISYGIPAAAEEGSYLLPDDLDEFEQMSKMAACPSTADCAVQVNTRSGASRQSKQTQTDCGRSVGTQSSVRLFECSSQTDFTCALLFSNGYGLCDDTSGPEEDKYGTPEKKAVIAVTLPQRMTKQDFFPS